MKKEIIYLIILVIFISLFGLLVLKKQVKKENTDLEKEVVDLKILVSKQTQLIEQLLNRLT